MGYSKYTREMRPLIYKIRDLNTKEYTLKKRLLATTEEIKKRKEQLMELMKHDEAFTGT